MGRHHLASGTTGSDPRHGGNKWVPPAPPFSIWCDGTVRGTFAKIRGNALPEIGTIAQNQIRRSFLWKVSFIAGLGGILYGFDMGIIAAALIFVRETFSLPTRMEEIDRKS